MSRAAVIFRSLVLSLAVGASFAVVPTLASARMSTARGSTTTCTAPPMSEVFSWAGDTTRYAALPGEKWDSMRSAGGWTLSGGAKFETVTLLDGTKGSVLDLPSGSEAITPAICVTSDYPSARTEIEDVAGSAGVNVYVSYGDSAWTTPLFSSNVAGSGTAWSLTKPFSIIRSNVSSWQLARFVLVPQGTTSEYRVSNFYVDPRMHH